MKTKSILDNMFVSSLILIALLSVVVWMWLWIPHYLAADMKGLPEMGQYGDSFGSVNSLFTGLAFAALVFTILLQQREIKLQRDDLKSQMEEMRLSRSEIKRQGDLQHKQLALDAALLKVKKLEMRIVEIQVIAEQWVPNARVKNVHPMFEEVMQEMEKILDEIRDDT